MNDDNQCDLDPLSARRDPRQHPVHLNRMGEAHDHFVDRALTTIGPDPGPREGPQVFPFSRQGTPTYPWPMSLENLRSQSRQ
jgi:hypothetical protein